MWIFPLDVDFYLSCITDKTFTSNTTSVASTGFMSVFYGVRVAPIFVFCFVFFVFVLCLVPNVMFIDCPFLMIPSIFSHIIVFYKLSHFLLYLLCKMIHFFLYQRNHVKMTCIQIIVNESITESRTESKIHPFLVILLSVTYSSSALTWFIRYIHI